MVMLLFEIETKTKTKTQTKVNFNNLWDQLLNQATNNGEITISPTLKKELRADLVNRVADLTKTRQKTSQVQLPAAAAVQVLNLVLSDLKDEISDAQAAANAGLTQFQPAEEPVTYGYTEEPTKPETLPAIINKEISTQFKGIEPEWHMVKHLPGYLSSAIRAMGRQVFKPFTKTPIEKIQVLADLSGSGPNTELELNAAASWLKQYAVRDQEAELEFHDLIPGYKADVRIFNSSGFTFMLVKDEYGRYIYAWPGGRGVHLGTIEKRPALPEK